MKLKNAGMFFCYNTAIGTLTIVVIDGCVTGVFFGEAPAGITPRETPLHRTALDQIAEYLAGRRRVFDLPLETPGTVFQQAVWDALRRIPWGRTRTYKEIAGEIGREKAVRAVGQAIHHNPVAIVIPCHRVVGSGAGPLFKKLTGFAGGLPLKQRLLELEGHRLC
jgi:methylated-DNA-[protein]-cysteine S-methyltransferase